MTEADRKTIEDSLEHLRQLHTNISSMWDSDALAAFYYTVLSGAIARNGSEVARPLMAVLSEVYTNTAKSHVDLGRLTTGFPAAQSKKSDDTPAGN